MQEGGYHVAPQQAEFQVQAIPNHQGGDGAAGRRGFAGYLKTKEAKKTQN